MTPPLFPLLLLGNPPQRHRHGAMLNMSWLRKHKLSSGYKLRTTYVLRIPSGMLHTYYVLTVVLKTRPSAGLEYRTGFTYRTPQAVPTCRRVGVHGTLLSPL